MKRVHLLNTVIFIAVTFVNCAAFLFLLSLAAVYFPAYTSRGSDLLMRRAILEHFWLLCVNLNLG